MSLFSTDLRDSAQEIHPIAMAEDQSQFVYRSVGKRAFDLFVVFSTAWFTVPVIALLAFMIILTGRAPFYRQDRVGLNGKIFKIWKLQTMVPNAKEHLESYLASNADARKEWDTKQKLTNDPRITKIGSLLRKTSMDELPQLINVVNGTMSLIGPRPMMPEQRDQYYGRAYFRLRPGMSGLWQVSDRNETDFVGRVRFDELYDRQVSIVTDLRVIFLTVAVVMRGTGV